MTGSATGQRCPQVAAVRAALTDVVRADLLRLLAQQQLALHRDLEVIIRRVGRHVRVRREVAGLVQLIVQLLGREALAVVDLSGDGFG